MLKTKEVGVRDPFVFLDDDGTYYMYGTRPKTVWGHGDGFDVYRSLDLENWEGPQEVFHKSSGFWADREYWASEVSKYRGSYYLLATFGSDATEPVKGIQFLKSDTPVGPFSPLTSDPLTPRGWDCLDGTLYVDDANQPWLICSHSVPQETRGEMCACRLSSDLKHLEGSMYPLFYAKDVTWTQNLPFAQAEFGVPEGYFSDGPYLFKNTAQQLCMLWSSWYHGDYAMTVSVSPSGKITGPWHHQVRPIVEHGGHGMVFRTKSNRLVLTYHSPNDTPNERAVFQPLSRLMSKGE